MELTLTIELNWLLDTDGLAQDCSNYSALANEVTAVLRWLRYRYLTTRHIALLSQRRAYGPWMYKIWNGVLGFAGTV